MNVMIHSPCRECEQRHINCHSECPKYAEYRAKIEADNHNRYMEADANSARFEGFERVLADKRRGMGKHTREYYYAKKRGCIDASKQ